MWLRMVASAQTPCKHFLNPLRFHKIFPAIYDFASQIISNAYAWVNFQPLNTDNDAVNQNFQHNFYHDVSRSVLKLGGVSSYNKETTSLSLDIYTLV